MHIVPYIFFAALGAIVGSFLNVVIYRLHTGKSLGGRSHCMSCGRTLSWYELVPVVSYILLRGRCHECSSYIPSRYLIVEVLTAFLFMLAWYAFPHDLLMLVLSLILFAFFVVILVYDIRHTIIPDEMTIGVGAVAAIYLGYLYLATEDVSLLLMHISGGVAAAFFFWSLWYLSKGRWIGFGDAKLALPLGAIVGGTAAFSMVVFSFWIGAAVALLFLLVQHLLKKGTTKLLFGRVPLTMKSEIPFAPFLLAGFLLTYIFHADTFSIIERIFPW